MIAFAISSETLAWLGLAGTVSFGLLGVYFYWRSRRSKRLGCNYTQYRLQTKTHPDVEILFKKQPITSLSRFVVCFWNEGTEEIRKADIPQEASLSVCLPGCRILSVAVLATADEHIRFSVAQHGDDCVRVDFEYLNPLDGGVFEILADTSSSARSVPDVSAPLIGGGPSTMRHYTPRELAVPERVFLTATTALVGLGGVFILGFGISGFVKNLTPVNWIAGALATALAAVALYVKTADWRTHRLPRFARLHFPE